MTTYHDDTDPVAIYEQGGFVWFHRLDREVNEWERGTLLANGFKLDDDARRYRAVASEGAMHAARRIKTPS